MSSSDISLFALFLAANLIACSVNHIDDTDETYGYWEPLHYLAHGVGMQTWEYAPQYAIRTYGFIYPIYLAVFALMRAGLSKVMAFYSVKALLGTATALAQQRFIKNLDRTVGSSSASNAAVLLLFAPGVFFASTAYLPSAVCMTLLMLSLSEWLENRFVFAIIWGSIAVLSTGWPFVGLFFAPMGLHMIYSSYIAVIAAKGTHRSAFRWVLQLFAYVALVGVIAQALVMLLDYRYYGRWTSPTLNILLYNAIGGSGDELYGIEPASYYVKNLFLNMGVAWPLALASPAVYLLSLLSGAGEMGDVDLRAVVLHVQALVWLAVLFTRPHKEERFLYPVYPLLAYIAGNTLDHILRILTALFGAPVAPRSPNGKTDGKKRPVPRAWVGNLQNLILVGCTSLAFALFVSRVTSNYVNYGGYIRLWRKAGEHVTAARLAPAPTSDGADSPHLTAVNICTGSEWYQFPSHFFLPEGARLQYISDGFGGILPQHFAPRNGTAAAPLQPFNDRNQEVTERYVSPNQCDYIVVLVDLNDPNKVGELRSKLLLGEPLEGRRFRKVASEKVISQQHSAGAGLFRAYYVPLCSPRLVKFQVYLLFEAVR